MGLLSGRTKDVPVGVGRPFAPLMLTLSNGAAQRRQTAPRYEPHTAASAAIRRRRQGRSARAERQTRKGSPWPGITTEATDSSRARLAWSTSCEGAYGSTSGERSAHH